MAMYLIFLLLMCGNMFLHMQVCVYVQVCVCACRHVCAGVCVHGGWRTTLVSGLGILSSFFATDLSLAWNLPNRLDLQAIEPGDPSIPASSALDRKHALLHQTFYKGPGNWTQVTRQALNFTNWIISAALVWAFIFLFLAFWYGCLRIRVCECRYTKAAGSSLGGASSCFPPCWRQVLFIVLLMSTQG